MYVGTVKTQKQTQFMYTNTFHSFTCYGISVFFFFCFSCLTTKKTLIGLKMFE